MVVEIRNVARSRWLRIAQGLNHISDGFVILYY